MKANLQEAFTNPKFIKLCKQNLNHHFCRKSMGNVALPEIQYNPKRQAAPPAFNPAVEKNINEKQRMVQKTSFPNDPRCS